MVMQLQTYKEQVMSTKKYILRTKYVINAILIKAKMAAIIYPLIMNLPGVNDRIFKNLIVWIPLGFHKNADLMLPSERAGLYL